MFVSVSGMGFGVMSGAFSLIDVLADAVGPGTMDLQGGSENFLLISAATTLCFILLHTFWGVIFFAAMDANHRWKIAFVVGSHLFISSLVSYLVNILNKSN
jgi:anterior pharynx defective protein 1